jgi:hypothetical protein
MSECRGRGMHCASITARATHAVFNDQIVTETCTCAAPEQALGQNMTATRDLREASSLYWGHCPKPRACSGLSKPPQRCGSRASPRASSANYFELKRAPETQKSSETRRNRCHRGSSESKGAAHPHDGKPISSNSFPGKLDQGP